MPKQFEPFFDPVLGEVKFVDIRLHWRFDLRLRSGKSIPGTITPENEKKPLHDQGLDVIVRRVAWLVEHEQAIYRRVAEKLFPRWQTDWFDPETDTVQSVTDFEKAISFSSLDVLEDLHPGVVLNDGGLYRGHAIVVTVGDDGERIYGPEF